MPGESSGSRTLLSIVSEKSHEIMSVVDPGRVSGSGLSDPEGPGWLSIVGSMMRGSSLKLDNSSGFDAGSGLFCMNSSSD